MCAVGMLIFKMPFIAMVTCVISFTAFIPVFGPLIGTAIGAFLILVESPAKALGFVIMMIILQQIESNVIYPKIMGKQVGLPGIWVLVAVTLGGGFFNMIGVIISVPTCSVLYTLFDKWIKKRLEERNICHKSMSHDSSDPKSIIEEINEYEFEKDIQESFADDFKETEPVQTVEVNEKAEQSSDEAK
jgi:predicted PurR-regulated permease PerM